MHVNEQLLDVPSVRAVPIGEALFDCVTLAETSGTSNNKRTGITDDTSFGKNVKNFKALGAADVIAKPFDPMTLSDQVKAIWERT